MDDQYEEYKVRYFLMYRNLPIISQEMQIVEQNWKQNSRVKTTMEIQRRKRKRRRSERDMLFPKLIHFENFP